MKKILGIAIIILFLLLSLSLISCNESSFVFDNDTYYIEPEDTLTPKIKSVFKKKYTLSSSNPTIARIDGHEVIALKEGIVTITALSGDLVASAIVYIIKQEEYIGSLPEPLPQYVRVNFYIEDYIAIPPMEVRQGEAPSTPHILARPGYSFDGWYSNKACTKKYDFNLPITQNIIVYGQWKMREPQYIFDEVGTNPDTVYIKSLAYPNVPYTELTNLPTKTNSGKPVVGIGNEVLINKTSLIKVSIPDEYIFIGEKAFWGCSNLKTIELSAESNLRTIDNKVFTDCTSLEAISLPSSIKEIGEEAFKNCSALSYIGDNLPNNLKRLPKSIFEKTAISEINLENIEEIYEDAFKNCTNLKIVLNTHNVTLCEENAFLNTAIATSAESLTYIDTILINGQLATSFTVRTLELNEDTTLIADNALEHKTLNSALLQIQGDLPLLGKRCFNEDIAILVKDEIQFQQARNDEYWGNYRKQIFTLYKEGSFELLKGKQEGVDTYSILKYTGHDKHLDLNILDYDIYKIWTGAFIRHQLSEDPIELKTLTLRNVKQIRGYAIDVDTLLAIKIATDKSIALESKESIKRGCESLKIYVHEASTYRYKTNWSKLANIIYPYETLKENGLSIAILELEDFSHGQILQYFGDDERVELPASWDGTDIITVGEYAFQYNKDVKQIIISENIKKIEHRAFAYTKIETLEFLSIEPPEVIMNTFLYMNDSLEKILIPAGSTNAYKQVFSSIYYELLEEKE